jgi:leucyl-tRNA synthetase
VADLTEVERRTIVDDHRLAYLGEAPVSCVRPCTVLANEEVTAEGA